MSKFVCRISVFALAAVGAFAQSTIPPMVTKTSGMVGVAEGQTARLNVLNPGVAAPALGMICSATLSFLNSAGTVLKSATVTVTPGSAAAPFDLSGDSDLKLFLDEREQIRATVSVPAIVPPPASGPLSACTLIGTLEIFDSITKRTQSVLGGFHTVPTGPVTASNTSN